CQTALPLMAKTGGSIVNFSSAAGLRANPDFVAYGSAKSAIIALTKSIALWCARERNDVRVNSVHPGVVLTPNVESVAAMTPDPEATLEGFRQAQAIGRMGETKEIADLVLYLASDESSFSTGAAFVADGGMSL
ncbi:MAG: SDR family oxidoreductase, partial [Pseudomonadota bacterium]